MIPIIYSSSYNITACGLERLHPFDSRKYQRIQRWLIAQGLRKASDFVAPRPCRNADLLRVHAPDYLRSLKDRHTLARILEVPQLKSLPAILIDWRVLRPMRWATGGTIMACRLAVDRGLAVNLAGGYHHASGQRGGGFCVYADAPLALALLKDEGRINTALVIDTDVHQGDGTADAIRAWPWSHMLDFYQDNLFPYPKAVEDVSVPLSDGMVGSEYLKILAENLPKALERFNPDLVIYNAGSDVLVSDPLAGLMLKATELAERDLYVVSAVRERGIPLAMVLSGGYGPVSWKAHAESLEGILTRFDKTT
jgi:histone deacetylase 11